MMAFLTPASFPAGINPAGIAVEDYNGDGKSDMAVVNSGAVGTVSILRSNGDGTFAAPTTVAAGAYPVDATAGVTVLMNANTDMANTAVGFIVTTPATTTSGSSLPMTVTAVDANGNTTAGFFGNVYITSSDPAATLAVPYTFTVADAGSHTFDGSVRLVTLGDQTVTVASPTLTPSTSSVSVTPAVTRFGLSAPVATAAGDTFNVVDASNAATLATVTNFEVMNAAASKFVLAVPSNITAGMPFSLRVTVLDAYGNRVKNYFGTIHFSNTAGITGLPADYTYDSIDAGDHSFTVTLDTVGNQTLSVADILNPALKSSAAISVKAAVVSGGGGSGGGSGKKV